MFDSLIEFLGRSGYLGIAALMFLENLFPPIPSELIMPSAGYTAGQGKLNLFGVIAAGTAGSLAGSVFWYCIGRWFGALRLKRWAARHGRWLALRPRDVDRANDWFRRHCAKAVFLGRLVPAFRTLVSIPAGIFQMSLPRFLLYTALGSAFWTALLAMAGYWLQGEYLRVAAYLNPISTFIIAAMVLTYFYRVVTFRN